MLSAVGACAFAWPLAASCAGQIWPQPPRPLPTPTTGQPTGQPAGGGQSPSMKKSDKVEVPRARERRSYDRARDATYVNVVVTLVERPADAAAGQGAEKGKGKKDKAQPAAFEFKGREVTLTFQLAYRGAHTYDLIGAHLIVESVAAPGQGGALAAATQLELKADPYEYAYERAEYRTELVALGGAAPADAPPVKRETAAFRLPVEDLPQIANAGRLALKIGAEQFAVRSAQLTELRRTLTAGVEE